MAAHIVYFLIEVAVQTVLLTLGLWIMILIQKLNYRFLPLLGTAALVSAIDEGLDEVLSHFLGTYLTSSISTPFVLAVLYFCLKKITQADRTDIYYTAAVGYALVFVMNIWLMGALIGNLRPSVRYADRSDTSAPALALETNNAAQAEAGTNSPPRLATNAPPKAAQTPAEDGAAAIQPFTIKGLIRNGAKSVVTIESGGKAYPLFMGDKVSVQTAGGPVIVVFKQLDENSVVLTINGTDTTMDLP